MSAILKSYGEQFPGARSSEITGHLDTEKCNQPKPLDTISRHI